MAKYTIIKEVPENLGKDCVVIDAPNFLEEIASNKRKKPRTGLLTTNYLREIIASIGDKYADDSFNALTSVNVSNCKGVSCEEDKDIDKVLFRVFGQYYPEMVNHYVDYHIKQRPYGTKLIYFLGDFSQSSKFTEHGIDEIKNKDIPVYLGNQKKKIVGKPAVTAAKATQKS